jgi:MFS superfamily sulfate permease-like transporter
VGLLHLAVRAVRLGFLADLLSRPVLIGYLAGVALIMADQLPRLMGVRTGNSESLPRLWPFLTRLSHVHPAGVALSATTLVFLVAVVDEQTEPVRRFVLNIEATVEVDITALDAADGLLR